MQSEIPIGGKINAEAAVRKADKSCAGFFDDLFDPQKPRRFLAV